MKNILSLLLLFWILGSAQLATSAVIYVDTNASGSDNGLSWINAYNDLQDGLAAATSGDEIWVANGVYKPTSTTDRDIAFVISSGVSLYGGFAGGEANRSDRDWNANATTLSGAIGSQVDVTDNSKRLIRINGATESIVISGFKIQRAYSESVSNFSVINSESVSFRQCEFRINYTSGFFMYIQYSKVDFKDCLFRDNEAVSMQTLANEAIVNDINSTYANNIVGYSLFSTSADESYLSLQNGIIAENTMSGPVCNTGNFSQAENCIITNTNLGFTATTNISSDDPMFQDPASNNFHLMEDSPAIGWGNNSFTSQGFDLAHEFRISGADVDAGCYERDVPTRLYVDVDATGLNNGANWGNAFNDLQDALAEADPGDQVWVAEGTYYPTSGTSRSAKFSLLDEVKLYGGFEGTETQLDQRNWESNLTRLSGDIGVTGDISDNSYHVVMASYAVGNAHIDGFVVENGNASSGSLNGEGGGISVQATNNCEITNCWVHSNRAIRGGGIHVRHANGDVVISQCVILTNFGDDGAGLYFDEDVEVQSCFFYANSTDYAGTVYGVSGSDLNMTNCTFYGNSVLSGSQIIDGTGTNDSWEIVNCIIWGNLLDNGVEAIRNVGPNTNVRLSIIQNGHTGGVDVYNEDPMFINIGLGDFGLQTSSVGFNAGDDSVVDESNDAFRNERIRAGQVDFGAVESSGTPESVIYVDIDASGANDGSSWEDAYTSLHDALDDAVDGDHVWVAEGTYIADRPSSTDDSFQTYAGIHLIGGFNGTETYAGQADWQQHETILSGDKGITNELTDNTRVILDIKNDETPVVISGFIIEDQFADSFDSVADAAVNMIAKAGYSGPSNIDFQNCIVRDNVSIENTNSGLFISAYSSGGPYTVNLENCLFNNNQAANAIVGIGTFNIDLNAIGCTFANNSIGFSYGSQLSGVDTVNNCVFWNNSETNSSVSGSFGNSPAGDNNIIQYGSLSGTNNIIQDPLFVDASNQNFQLMPGSPAIDMGENSIVSLDFDLNHNERIQFGNVDLGAFESAYDGLDCLGDFDGDGSITTSDLLELLAVYTTNCGFPYCGGDMNGDANVDTSDLLDFLSVFGTVCP